MFLLLAAVAAMSAKAVLATMKAPRGVTPLESNTLNYTLNTGTSS